MERFSSAISCLTFLQKLYIPMRLQNLESCLCSTKLISLKKNSRPTIVASRLPFPSTKQVRCHPLGALSIKGRNLEKATDFIKEKFLAEVPPNVEDNVETHITCAL